MHCASTACKHLFPKILQTAAFYQARAMHYYEEPSDCHPSLSGSFLQYIQVTYTLYKLGWYHHHQKRPQEGGSASADVQQATIPFQASFKDWGVLFVCFFFFSQNHLSIFRLWILYWNFYCSGLRLEMFLSPSLSLSLLSIRDPQADKWVLHAILQQVLGYSLLRT